MLDKLSTIFERPWIYCALIIVKAAFVAQLVMGGTLVGNDDYMRITQVSDLIEGQAWFDTYQDRFITDEGGDIHWSRVPDVGITAVYMLVRPLMGHEQGLQFAALAWPTFLFCGLILVLVSLLKRMGAGAAGIIFALVVILNSYGGDQFQAGRVDHHGLNILLALAALRLLLAAPLWTAALAGVLIMAMVSIAIESLPLVFGLLLVFGLSWVANPERQGVRLGVLGGSLVASAGLFFLLDAPGLDFRVRAVCDAYGSGHFAAISVGGLGLVVLSVLQRASVTAPILATYWGRILAGAIVGGLGLTALVLVAPYCLASPYADVPELVKTQWLNRVTEARSFFADVEARGASALARYFVPCASLLAGLWWMRRAAPEARETMQAILIMLAVALLVAVWQVRGLTAATLFAALPAAVVFDHAFKSWRQKGGPEPLAGALICCVALAPVMPIQIGSKLSPPPNASPLNLQGEVADCTAPASIAPLGDLPSGLVLAHIDYGAPLLHLTDHKIVAAPYHRNISGIAAYYEAIGSETDEQFLDRVRAIGAEYVLVCDNGRTAGLENGRVKQSLVAGEPLSGLTPIALSETPLRIFRVD